MSEPVIPEPEQLAEWQAMLADLDVKEKLVRDFELGTYSGPASDRACWDYDEARHQFERAARTLIIPAFLAGLAAARAEAEGLRAELAELTAQLVFHRRQAANIIEETGVVRHTDPAECVGCGCMSLTAEEAVSVRLRWLETQLATVAAKKVQLATDNTALIADRDALRARVAELEAGLRESRTRRPLHTGRLDGREFVHSPNCLRCRLAALLADPAADPGPGT